MKSTEEELRERLGAHPDDIESWLVLGDLFQEQGDPRGELIAIESKIKACQGDTETDKLVATKAALIEEHRGLNAFDALDQFSDRQLCNDRGAAASQPTSRVSTTPTA